MGPEAARGPGLSPMDAAVHQISVLEYGCWFGAAPARPHRAGPSSAISATRQGFRGIHQRAWEECVPDLSVMHAGLV